MPRGPFAFHEVVRLEAWWLARGFCGFGWGFCVWLGAFCGVGAGFLCLAVAFCGVGVGFLCLAVAFCGFGWGFCVWPWLFVGLGGAFVFGLGLFVGLGWAFCVWPWLFVTPPLVLASDTRNQGLQRTFTSKQLPMPGRPYVPHGAYGSRHKIAQHRMNTYLPMQSYFFCIIGKERIDNFFFMMQKVYGEYSYTLIF